MKQHESQRDTIIYGGAFNPPTRAHQAILQACIERAEDIDADVWLLPSGDRSDKTIEVSREDRLRMLNALVNDVVKRTVNVGIETSELYQTVQTETYDTVQRFKETYTDRRFIWVYGSDSIKTMPEWHEGDKLIEEPMLVVERPGTPIGQLGRLSTKLAVNQIEVSSTDVRTLLDKGEDVHDLVPPTVEKILQASHR